MKKIFRFLSLLSFSVLFFSCDFEITDGKITRPDIEPTASGYDIIPSIENSRTTNITIYRRDVTSSSNVIEQCIGMVIPSSYDSDNTSYAIEDTHTIIDKYYQYSARYTVTKNDGTTTYYFTDWTTKFKAEAGLANTVTYDDLVYDVSSTTFTYDSTAMTITIGGSDPTEPAEIADFSTNYTPALAAEIEDSRRYFTLDSVDSGTVISLLTLFPEDFYGTDVKILGIVGQKLEKETDSEGEEYTKKVRWTDISEISLLNTSGTAIENNTIQLSTEYGDAGYDTTLPED